MFGFFLNILNRLCVFRMVLDMFFLWFVFGWLSLFWLCLGDVFEVV